MPFGREINEAPAMRTRKKWDDTQLLNETRVCFGRGADAVSGNVYSAGKLCLFVQFFFA